MSGVDISNDKTNRYEFQVLDTTYYHSIDHCDNTSQVKLVICGKDIDGKTVTVFVEDFCPYFYVKCNENIYPLRKDQINKTINNVLDNIKKNIMYRRNIDVDLCIKKTEYVRMKDMAENMKVATFAKIIFTDYEIMGSFKYAFDKYLKNIKRYVIDMNKIFYHSNLHLPIMFFHDRKLNPSGWISVDITKCMESIYKKNDEHICYSTTSNNILQPLTNERKIAPLIIMAYDIECCSPKGFPMSSKPNNPIIQIGMSFSTIANDEPYLKYLLSLKKCSPIEGVIIECFDHIPDRFDAEMAMLLRFAEITSKYNPDVNVAHNGFGFDDFFIVNKIIVLTRIKLLKKYGKLDNISFDEELTDSVLESNGISMTLEDNLDIDKFFHKISKYRSELLSKNEDIGPLACMKTKKMESKGAGNNMYNYLSVPGILSLDTLKLVQNGMQKLVSNTLDSVAFAFIRSKVDKIEYQNSNIDMIKMNDINNDNIILKLFTKRTKYVTPSSFIQLIVDDKISPSTITTDNAEISSKMKVLEVDKDKSLTIQCHKILLQKIIDIVTCYDYTRNDGLKIDIMYAFTKDDMSISDMNKYYIDGDPDKIALIGRYNINDCVLLNGILEAQKYIPNIILQANVCYVPNSYIMLYGQGAKIGSLLVAKCKDENILLGSLDKINNVDTDKYEGARVVDPIPGVYEDYPIGVLDYSALYPSNMIVNNMSIETLVSENEWLEIKSKILEYANNKDPDHIVEIGGIIEPPRTEDGKIDISKLKYSPKIPQSWRLDNMIYHESTFKNKKDQYVSYTFSQEIVSDEIMDIEIKNRMDKDKNEGNIVLSYNEYKANMFNCVVIDGEKQNRKYGILPKMLVALLNERKKVNSQKNKTDDPLIYSILDALQLALKVVANSIYGQTGSPFSPIYCLAIAEKTTYRGRCSLDHAIMMAELNDGTMDVKVAYGDTDSIFSGFPALANEPNIDVKIEKTISNIKYIQGIINSFLIQPMSMAYEKTYFPFAIESKKKYFGRRYEKNGVDFTISIMGIEIKKRDRSEVCKKVLSKVIKGILDYTDKEKILSDVNNILSDMINDKYPLEMYTTSKSYKGTYEKSNNNSLRILADRITMRDPGSRPNVGDRIQYLHIINDKKLQGDKIELLSYVKENNMTYKITGEKKIKVDYVHYLVNQIKTPLENILFLIIDKYRIEHMFGKIATMYENIVNNKHNLTTLLNLNVNEHETGIKILKAKSPTKKASGVIQIKRKPLIFK